LKLRTLILRLLGAIIASLVSGAVAGWVVLQLPCSRFGSGFEGACGYAGAAYSFSCAMNTSIAVMLIGTALAFLYPSRDD